MKRLSIFFAALLVSVGSVFAAEDIVASWMFTSDAYPKNSTNFEATDGTWKTNSSFYLNGTGSTWNTNKGYAFTAVTDITITVTAGSDIPRGAALKLEATTAFNKEKNAPMTGFDIACKVNGGTANTTGVSAKSWTLSTTATSYDVTYTTQEDLKQGATISFILTQTGKAGSGQGYINNISVTYTAEGGTTEPVAVESIALDQTVLSLEAGKTATLVATITPANATNKSVTWATDNDKVATVADGVVTAVAEGTANITVTTADGAKTATCAVTVTAVKPIDGMNYSVNLGTTAGYNTWTIDNKELSSGLTYVWKCDADKKYAKGSAYAGSNKAAEAWLISPKLDLSKAEVATMTINHALNFLNGNPNPMSVQGTKDGVTWDTLEVNGWPAGNSWAFNDATVDLTSVISASTQIAFVYKSTTEVAPTWEIKTVAIKGSEAVHATEVKLDKETLEMEQYKNSQLTATLTPAEATDLVEWASDNEKVATVSATGVVTAVGVGTANIIATANSVSATCAVTVVTATSITCAQAVELAKAVSGNNVAAEGGMYVIRGYVTAYEGTPADDMKTYKNYSAWLADTKGGEGIFLAFQVKPVDGTTVAAVGDFVEVVGDITQYTKDDNTKYETMGKGTATIKVLPNPSTAIDDINADGVVVEKVVRNGQVLIVRDGKTYNVIGKMVD